MQRLNNRGKTLIEMLIVLMILGIIASVAYPMIFMNEKITTNQIDESAKRNDIRALENFLKEDLRNSKTYSPGGSEDDYIYIITLNDGSLIKYKQEINDKGQFYISREIGSERITFQEINELKLDTRVANEKLIEVEITSTDGKGDPYLHNSKIARWEWKIKKIQGEIGDFLLNEALVMGNSLEFNNSINIKASENGPVGSILLKDNLHVNKKAEIEGNLFIGKNGELNAETEIEGNVSVGENLHINKKAEIEGNISVGNNLEINHETEIEGNVSVGQNFHINKKAEIEGNISVGDNLQINHETEIKGNVSVKNNVNINKEAKIKGNLSLGGSLEINDEVEIDGNLYIAGNLRINKKTEVKRDVYVAGNLTINGEEEIKGKVYYGGTLQPNKYRTDSRFIKKDAQFFIDKINITPVSIVPIPEVILPEAREMAWYRSNDYVENGTLGVDRKIVSQWGYSKASTREPEKDVVIVSLDGDIVLDLNNKSISGILYAPKGRVEINNGKSFTGLIISKEKFSYNKSGFEVTFKSMAEFTGPGLLFESSSDYPFIIQE